MAFPRTWLALSLALSLGACSQARIGDPAGFGGSGAPDGGAGGRGPDAAGLRLPDAQPSLDAGPTASRVTHSADTAILPDHSVACIQLDPILHTQNSYYRVFDLQQDFDIDADFEVSSISFGIQEARAGNGGTQPMKIVLHTLEGNLAVGDLTQIAAADVNVDDQTLSLLEVPLEATVPAGEVLVVELVLPDGRSEGNVLFVGMNDAGQSSPTYLLASECGIDQPTDLAQVQDGNGNTFPDRHLVLEVTGSSP